MSPEFGEKGSVTAEMVREAATERLDGLLQMSVDGYRVNREMLLEALVYAAAEGTSLHGVCGTLERMADDTTLRDHLNTAFPPDATEALNQRGKAVVLASVPKAVFKRRHEIAIDLKDFPYYGHHPDLNTWVCRGPARAGTTRFLRIATAYVMRRGQRVTLAVIQVAPGLRLGEVIRALVGHLRFGGVSIATLHLDRGFASVDVIRTLERMRLPAVVACPLRGSETSGVRQYCTGRSCRTAHHRFMSRTDGFALAALAVVRSFSGGRRTRKRARWFVYILVGTRRPPTTVHRAYRSRFGIESSYRLLNQIRPRTTSRNPTIRLLMVLVGVLLANLWIAFKRLIGRRLLEARGFRIAPVEHIDEACLRLHRLKLFLRHAVEQRYGLQLTLRQAPL